jgi:predicted DNA-binding transcriptional regulator YafY
VDRKGMRTYGLERIEKLETGEKRFTVDASFNADLFFKHSLGITERSEKPEKIELRFESSAGKYLVTQPIHPSQEVLKTDKKFISIGLHVLITTELINLILSYGHQVQVIKPKKLVSMVQGELQKALEQYNV